MWRIALKQVAAHRFRFLLTSLAVVLGVTFVSGTLVLTDTAQRQFDDKFAGRNSGYDLTIRTEVAFDEAMGVEVEHEPVPADLLDRADAVPGVEEAAGVALGSGTILYDGSPVGSTGRPVLMSWTGAPFGGFDISSGRAPEGPGEVVVDTDSARRAGIALGDRVAVQSDRVGRFRVVGLADAEQSDAYKGTSVALVSIDDAQHLLRIGDRFSEIRVTADGDTAVSTVEDRLRDEVGTAFAVTSSKDVARASADAARTQLGYLQGMLLALAAAALLIGGYLIANTFTIVVAQRTRELALLRAAGATGRQVRRLLRGEAIVVGVVGSAIGTFLGIGAAAVLRGLLAGAGADLPSGPAVIRPGSMLTSFAIGVVVTTLAAVGPSRRAGKVSPLLALRSAAATAAGRRRRIIGALATVATVVAVGGVVVGDASVTVLALAAVLAVVALGALGPAFAGPLTRVIGRPLAAAGVPGRLAGEFASRSPRRTAATVLALALSVALVAFMTVLAASIKKDITDRYQEVIRVDLVVESSGAEMLGGLSPDVHDRIAALPEVEVASRMQFGHFKRASSTTALSAVDPATVEEALRIDLEAGELADLAGGGVMVSHSVAADEGLETGDSLRMTFPRDGVRRLPVVGIFDDGLVAAIQTEYLIDLDTYARHYTEDVDADVFVRLATGVDKDAAEKAINAALRDFPNAEVRDQEAAAKGRTAMVDQVLGLVTVLLMLTVLIALLGVTNTLALSIVERTREIGLLRAIGMTGAQVRWMVRSEAVLQAAVAVVLGSVLGLGFAAATVVALSSSGTMAIVVPWAALAVLLGAGTLAGLAAGLLPARRAARLPLMGAIATA
jgi:putative ABC transport system permease protein